MCLFGKDVMAALSCMHFLQSSLKSLSVENRLSNRKLGIGIPPSFFKSYIMRGIMLILRTLKILPKLEKDFYVRGVRGGKLFSGWGVCCI